MLLLPFLGRANSSPATISTELLRFCLRISKWKREDQRYDRKRSTTMDGNIIGLVAVTMALGIPIAAMYTFYRVRKLRTDEKIAAMARGVAVPMEPELSQVARSRRSGILLTALAIGYIITFSLIARFDHDAWIASYFGIIPLALGVGFFIDAFLVRRDLTTS